MQNSLITRRLTACAPQHNSEMSKEANIHVVFLDLVIVLTSTESTWCAHCSISRALGMQEGHTSLYLLRVYTWTLL